MIVALLAVAVLAGTALAPLVADHPTATAFLDRLAFVAVAVATLGVLGLGMVCAVLMVTGKPTPSITTLRPGRPGQDIRTGRRSIRRGK